MMSSLGFLFASHPKLDVAGVRYPEIPMGIDEKSLQMPALSTKMTRTGKAKQDRKLFGQ